MKRLVEFIRCVSNFRKISLPFLVVSTAGALLVATNAHAVPSFARQTGMACAACHTMFPELTPFGRSFKMNGYVIANLKTVRDILTNRQDILELDQIPPISFMFQTSYTKTNKAIPDSAVAGAFAQNGNVLFPQQASLFYAGRIASQLGAFIQFTYSTPDDHFSWDNTVFRYANNMSDNERGLVWGVTLNNNPTVQDPWNSTPAWGFPWVASSVAPNPAAATMLDGTLAQQVAGLTAFLFWNNAIYGEVGVYRSAQVNSAQPPDSTASNTIHNVAPYWRFAWQHQWGRNSLEIGTVGMRADIFPGSGTPLSGATNTFTDLGLDSQFQFIGDKHIFSVLASYIHERQNLDASFAAGGSSNSSINLQTFKLAANYYYNRRYGISIGYFKTTGSTDALLYPSNAVVVGSASHSPDSDGWIGELDYVPWLNIKISLQYTLYTKFNGGDSNYDGFGRDAGDNNTLYISAVFNF